MTLVSPSNLKVHKEPRALAEVAKKGSGGNESMTTDLDLAVRCSTCGHRFVTPASLFSGHWDCKHQVAAPGLLPLVNSTPAFSSASRIVVSSPEGQASRSARVS